MDWEHGWAQNMEWWRPRGLPPALMASITYESSDGRYLAEVGGYWRQWYRRLGMAQAGVERMLSKIAGAIDKTMKAGSAIK